VTCRDHLTARKRRIFLKVHGRPCRLYQEGNDCLVRELGKGEVCLKMRQTWIGLLCIVLSQRPCLGQNQEPVNSVQPSPLPTIVDSRPGTQPKLLDEQALLAPPAPSKLKECDPVPVAESLISFSQESLQLTWSPKGWQLKSDEVLLKDFGRNETLARQTLLLIRELRLNQYGSVGQPRAVLEYWLSDGHAPQGLPTGLRVVALDQASLRVEQAYQQWCVRDAYRMLLNFQGDEDSAHRALAILHKHQFTQFGTLGSFPPTLIFLRQPGDSLQQIPSSQTPATSRNQGMAAVQSTMAPSLFAPVQLPRIINGSSCQSSQQRPGSER
jgi:hypothetical protein